jgi:hypothetical protein
MFRFLVGGEDRKSTSTWQRHVKAHLVRQGVESMRLSTSGRGKDEPVADNGSADGRQTNRRVEVIINNPASALR